MSADSSSPTMKAHLSYASSHTSSLVMTKNEILQRDNFGKMHLHSSSDFPAVDQRVKDVGIDTMDHLNDSTVSGCLGPLNVHMRTKSGLDECLYELLDSMRVAHRNCNVLDRYVSTGNIMSRDSVVPLPLTDIAAEEISKGNINLEKREELPAVFCGSRYLLGDTADRSFTKSLLIDLEGAGIVDQAQDTPRAPRTGTVQFMARAIREGRLLGDNDVIPLFGAPPEISETLLARYSDVLPDRGKRFACKAPRHSPGIVEKPSNTITRHALRHDAESVCWVMMWWAVCAVPEGTHGSSVPSNLWVNLTDKLRDDRSLRLRDGDLHPSYAALQKLLVKLGTYMDYDHHWATEAPYNHAEFLHEAFQRIILNFLINNENEEFMLLPKSGVPRGHTHPAVWAEPTESRHQYLLRTSGTGNSGSSQKRGASSQGELEREVKKTTAPVASSSTGVTTRSQ